MSNQPRDCVSICGMGKIFSVF